MPVPSPAAAQDTSETTPGGADTDEGSREQVKAALGLQPAHGEIEDLKGVLQTREHQYEVAQEQLAAARKAQADAELQVSNYCR